MIQLQFTTYVSFVVKTNVFGANTITTQEKSYFILTWSAINHLQPTVGDPASAGGLD